MGLVNAMFGQLLEIGDLRTCPSVAAVKVGALDMGPNPSLFMKKLVVEGPLLMVRHCAGVGFMARVGFNLSCPFCCISLPVCCSHPPSFCISLGGN